MSEKQKPSRFHFADFSLDLERRGLYRGQQRIRLTSKPLETLIFLLENRGRIVEKQELMDAVWKDTFVTEDNLVHAIREIRRVLEDDREDPRFIQTVPRLGYRFLAEISSEPRRAPEQIRGEHPGQDTIPAEARRFFKYRVWALGGGITLLLALITGLWWKPWGGSRPQGPKQHLISTSAGSHRALSFSADGSMIAYINAVNGVPQVWVRHLSQGDAIQITFGDIPAERPRWSPANDQIAFVRGRGASPSGPVYGSESIWSVPAPLGGPPRKLIDQGRNPNWSWDAARLVFERGDEIWIANADGSGQRKVEGVPPAAYLLADRMPSFSPDASLIAFFQSESGPSGDFWVIPSAGGQPRRLTFDVCMGSSPVWTPDGDFIVFSSKRAGSMTLWRIGPSRGEAEPLFGGAGEDTDPDVSRDGRKLIYTNTRNTYTLTILDPVTKGIREIWETRQHFLYPSFSPQGDKVSFFLTESEGGAHIYTIDTDGHNLAQITQGRREKNSFPQWAADGSLFYFYQVTLTTSFRRIPANGGLSSEVIPGWAWETEYGTRVSSTGKVVVYTKYEKGLPRATLIRDLETGDETALNLALDDPRWSSDDSFIVGTDLTASRPPEGDISLCPVNFEPCRKLTRGFNPVWSRDGSRIYFLRIGKFTDGAELWSISRDGVDERRIADLRPMHPIAFFYDVSPQGQIVYVQFKPGRQELWLSEFPRPN